MGVVVLERLFCHQARLSKRVVALSIPRQKLGRYWATLKRVVPCPMPHAVIGFVHPQSAVRLFVVSDILAPPVDHASSVKEPDNIHVHLKIKKSMVLNLK